MPIYETNRNEKLRFTFQLRIVLKNFFLCIIRQKMMPPGNSDSSSSCQLVGGGAEGGGEAGRGNYLYTQPIAFSWPSTQPNSQF
jgi:hypothetical protein